MAQIILNSKNVVPNSNNSRYRYEFQSTQKFENMSVSLTNLNIYYSWFNITSVNNNNRFRYKWFDSSGNLTTDNNVDIADGYYSVQTLNEKLQNVLYSRGHYLELTGNQVVYHLEILTSSTYYAIQLNVYPMVTSAQATLQNLTKPANATWNFPATTLTPRFAILDNNFQNLIGYKTGLYPATANTTTIQNFLSTETPAMSPVSSVIMTSNLIYNQLSNPTNVLYSFSIGTTGFGDIIDIKPNYPQYFKIPNGTYNNIEIEFLDQNFNRMNILDNQLIIVLTIIENEKK